MPRGCVCLLFSVVGHTLLTFSSAPLRKTYGDINGVPVGTFFLDRKQLFEAGVHGRPSWGIHGTEEDGAYAVVLNGGYEDDCDQGETVYVTFVS